MMDCRSFSLQMDDLLDRRVDPGLERRMQRHALACPGCRQRLESARSLSAALRALSAPAPREGFLEDALKLARSEGRRSRRILAGLALAATLVLGLALGVLLGERAPQATVRLAVDQPETVQLVFHSPKPLTAARLRLTLPDNVEIVGHRGRRELAWDTDLREGANRLQLPLVAHEIPGGELTARLSHGDASRTFRIRIEVRSAGGTS